MADPSLDSASMTRKAAALCCARLDRNTPSAPRNGVAGRPVALTTGRGASFHGTPLWMSVWNHGPEMAMAALPELNRVATSWPFMPRGTMPPSPPRSAAKRAAATAWGVSMRIRPEPSNSSPPKPNSQGAWP